MAVGGAESSTEAAEMISYGPAGFKGLVQNPFIFFQACVASIGGLLFGYDQGVISGVQVMTNFKSQFPQLASNTTLQGWMVSVLTLGAMFGALLNGPIADTFSRRWSILYANIVFLLGSAIQAGAVTIPMLFIGRFIAGVAVGMLSMVVPLYLSEVAPPNLRGSLVALQQLAITLGIMIAFWLDYGTQHIGGTGKGQSPAAWRFPLAFQCVPSLVLAGATVRLPYSPRWLVQVGREEEARAVLVRIRRVPESDQRIDLELLDIKAATIFDRESRAAKFPDVTGRLRLSLHEYRELIVVPHLNRRLLISSLLQVLQQFTGINAIIYYAPTMFTSIGLSSNSVDLLATGVVGIVNFFATIPAILYIDRWGRKKVLIIGAIGMSISQLIVGTLYAVYRDRWAGHTGAGWAAAVFIWVYIANFAYSIGCVNWIIPSELFPPAVRSKAVSIAISLNWLTNFIVALITPRMLASITFGTFYFFLVFCLILLAWVIFFVPETKGVPIEGMDRLFGGNTGHEDLVRMARIRDRLGILPRDEAGVVEKEGDGPCVEEKE
ncbi:general substrate transporter [Aspergillus germanicus]